MKMLKYTTAQVVFREVPDEITLAINISNCPIRCPDCHSKELWEDIGTELTQEELSKLISKNNGITCVAFMGGDSDPDYVGLLAKITKKHYPELKVAWYSGRDTLDGNNYVEYFDYIKLGPYVKEEGALDSPNTEQVFYKVKKTDTKDILELERITYKFLNKESE